MISEIMLDGVRLLRWWVIVLFFILTAVLVSINTEIINNGIKENGSVLTTQINLIWLFNIYDYKSKRNKLKYLLPGDAADRKRYMINFSKVLIAILVLWFLMIHVINILIGNYNILNAMRKFIGVDLIIALSIGYLYFRSKANVKFQGDEFKRDYYIEILAIILLIYSFLYALLLYHFLSGFWNLMAEIIAYISYIPILYNTRSVIRQIDIYYENIKRT